MTPEKETPAFLGLAGTRGTTGAGITGQSVPGWASKRRKRDLVHFRGEYLSPEALNLQARQEASQERISRGGPQAVDAQGANPITAEGPPGPRTPQNPGTSTADRFRRISYDTETGEILPCRSLETTQSNGAGKATPAALVGPRKKVALSLSWNVAHLCKQHGIERVGFLTLTFADHVTEAREAQRRFNSLATNILRKRYPAFVAVLERQKSGRIHYHLLVVLPDDIRTGIDFDAIRQGDYRTANKALRLEWAYWRKTAPVYRFGRTELLPIKSDADALGQYVGKYIAKGQAFRTESDKGVRLVRYSGGARMATCKFAELSTYPTEWRAKVCTFVWQMAEVYPHRRIRDMDDLAFHFGKRWAYEWRDYILALPPSDLGVPF
jgi:hypothetical protein